MDNITFIQLKPCNAASPYDEAASWFMHFLHIRVRGQSCQSMKKDDTAHPLHKILRKHRPLLHQRPLSLLTK